MMCGKCVQNGKLKIVSKPVKIGIFGLDNAGKTTATKAIIGESLETVAPTVGYSSYEKRIGQYEVTFYDLGGGKRVRDIWKHYLAEVYGLIFVIDSTEMDRLNECKEELQKLLSNTRVQGKPLLLLANKQDKANALDDREIVGRINLEGLVTSNRCHCRLELCSALAGVGNKIDPTIRAGLKWLLRIIDVLRETAGLEQRVIMDTEEARRIEREQAREKRLQVQKTREERAKAQENKNEDEKEEENISKGDPFKPIAKAVAEAEQRVDAPKAESNIKQNAIGSNQSDATENLLLDQHEALPTTGSLLPKIEEIRITDDGKSNEILSESGSEQTSTARRRRRRHRPGSNSARENNPNTSTEEAVGESAGPVPYKSNLSPIMSRQTSQTGSTPRTLTSKEKQAAVETSSVAASARLSGPLCSVEQQNDPALSATFTNQGGPNVTSSDAFI